MSARKKQIIVIVVLIVGGVLTLLGRRQDSEMERGIGIAVLFAGGLLEVILFRCPHCGRRLGKSFRPGRHYPYCGEKID